MTSSIYQLYGELWAKDDPDWEAQIRQSLAPRGPDILYDMFGALGVGPGHTVLDAGCRYGTYAIELARRFGCRVIAVDPIAAHIEQATQRIAEAGLHECIRASVGTIEALPVEDAAVDYIWCRDVLNHVELAAGLRECTRVLKPGGRMFVYITLATEHCEPLEAARLYAALTIIPENMSAEYLERAARAAGFEIAAREPIDSEWRESTIEGGSADLLEALLRIARMRRREAELVRQFGRTFYEVSYADNLWGIYQMLGKLCPTVYVLKKQSA